MYSENTRITNQIHGAFGELITAHKTPVVQISNKYDIDPALLDKLEVFEATGGAATNNGNLFQCSTGTSVGGYGVIRSKNTLNYKAGQGIEGQITAKFTTGIPLSLQFGGMFSITETVAFGYNGSNFGIIHEYGGAVEVQLITVTVTGAGTCTVTLDGDAVGITTTASTVQINAFELYTGLVANPTLNSKWRFEQIDDMVYCVAKSVGDKTGTMSISGGVTATISEQTVGVAKTSNNVEQADWNRQVTPFVGFDPTQLNIYKVRFGYLGVANIEYSVYNPNTGEWVLVHSVEWASAQSITHLGSPDLKIGWTAASLGASGTNLVVEGASASIMIEGDEVLENDTHALTASKTGIGTTLTNVLTLKNRVIYGDRYNHSKVKPLRLSIDNDHTKGAIIEIYKNATLGGTSNYQFTGEFNSVVIKDTLSTTVVGTDLIDAFTIPAGGSTSVELSGISPDFLPNDYLTVAVKTISGTGAVISVAITWREDK